MFPPQHYDLDRASDVAGVRSADRRLGGRLLATDKAELEGLARRGRRRGPPRFPSALRPVRPETFRDHPSYREGEGIGGRGLAGRLSSHLAERGELFSRSSAGQRVDEFHRTQPCDRCASAKELRVDDEPGRWDRLVRAYRRGPRQRGGHDRQRLPATLPRHHRCPGARLRAARLLRGLFARGARATLRPARSTRSRLGCIATSRRCALASTGARR